jgi:hypothetical protein
MAEYKLVNSSTGITVNVVEWDGVTEFNVGPDYFLELVTGSYIINSGSEEGINTQLYGGYFYGIGTGNFTGSFNGYSGSLQWLDAFATGSKSGSFSGSFTGSLKGTSLSSVTSSYVSSIKSGAIRFDQWTVDGIGEYTSSVTFSTAYDNISYAVTVTCGSDIRTLTIISKTTTGFTVSTNSTSAMTDSVYWTTVPYNNP